MEGVIVKDIARHTDERGWLAEIFRDDELTGDIRPAMSYVSLTHSGVARGPHEHIRQTDYFCFIGPSTFKVYLWDNRKDSKTYKEKMVFTAGEEEPKVVVVPPGVVHAYKNIGDVPGLVFNAPNRLYMGEGKKEDVDEVRHEDKADTEFSLD